MSFAFSVLFECVLNYDGFIHEELAVHGLNGCIGGFEICIGHESVAF